MQTYPINTMEDLAAAAADILAELRARADADGRIVAGLRGDLGTGKTTFVKTLATQMDVRDTVTSPTFIIMKRYEADAPPFQALVHIDAYRIEREEELRVLGFPEPFGAPHTLTCIEWPERVGTLMPERAAMLDFALNGETDRTLTVTYAEEN